jgi:hypothetical protein
VPLCGDQDMDFVEVSDSHILIKQFELPLKVINVCAREPADSRCLSNKYSFGQHLLTHSFHDVVVARMQFREC